MTDISIFTRHRDLFWAAGLSLIVFILSIAGIVDVSGLTGRFVLTIFGVVLGGVLSMVIIFQGYDKVMDRAEENELRPVIRQIFKYPTGSAALGAIYAFLLNILNVSFDIGLSQMATEYINITLDTILIFFVLYSLLSLAEGASFVYRITIGEAGTSEPNQRD